MILTLDIGGTNIKTGIFENSKFTQLNSYETGIKDSSFNMLDRISFIIDETQKYHKISGVAISTAGIVDSMNGKIAYANENIPNYKGTEISKYIMQKYNLQSTVENDVNCALLGELTQAKYRDVQNALMFTIGTGVGGALYVNGKLLFGHSFSGGEVGYSIFNGQNIEKIASTTSLVNNVKSRINIEEIDGKWIFDQAINYKNQICVEEIDKLVENIVNLVVNSVSLLNPEYVILGGGIMEQKEYLQLIIQEKFEKMYTNNFVKQYTNIEFAELGNTAGMFGAYEVYRNKIK
ncbi:MULTISPECIES: ROK family protein [Helcococcus]|uniref:ROK family protein n=1 Tax=Helcococcus bovis TaxID=3153252 RepID=A0ABW9F3U5_9FIRM